MTSRRWSIAVLPVRFTAVLAVIYVMCIVLLQHIFGAQGVSKPQKSCNNGVVYFRLEGFERERAQSITNIDHDRLDVKDFLKGVKHCASDQLPESKM